MYTNLKLNSHILRGPSRNILEKKSIKPFMVWLAFGFKSAKVKTSFAWDKRDKKNASDISLKPLKDQKFPSRAIHKCRFLTDGGRIDTLVDFQAVTIYSHGKKRYMC